MKKREKLGKEKGKRGRGWNFLESVHVLFHLSEIGKEKGKKEGEKEGKE